jgi:hypothetical protein
MWFNGTSLTEKARRALENEKVTIVSHISGHIHTVYNEATIDPDAYRMFSSKLKAFVRTDITDLVFINFLRFKQKYKNLFQYMCECSGKKRYISLEKMFEYEHTSKYNLSKETRASLVNEIEGDEFHLSPLYGKIMLNDIEEIFCDERGCSLDEFRTEFIKYSCGVSESFLAEMFEDLEKFTVTEPRLPDIEKFYTTEETPSISPENTREEIIKSVTGLTGKSEMALLTMYVYRQMDMIDWIPFIKASMERNPVCYSELESMLVDEVYGILGKMPDESIYDGNRLALPDEVWNFRRGDGVEKALMLADFIGMKYPGSPVQIDISESRVVLRYRTEEYPFHSSKGFRKLIWISGNAYSVKDLS